MTAKEARKITNSYTGVYKDDQDLSTVIRNIHDGIIHHAKMGMGAIGITLEKNTFQELADHFTPLGYECTEYCNYITIQW